MHEGVKADVFKKYSVSGGGYKLNVKCPHCQSTDRSRLLHLFFHLRTEVLHKKTRILHISPNEEVARMLCESETVEHVCGAIEPARFIQFNATRVDLQNIDFEDNQFDVVVCCHVIEHVQDDASAMREIYRVLKPGGFAILQVPLAINLRKTLEDPAAKTGKERKIAFGQVDHLRLYGLDYIDKLRNAGFRVVQDNPFENKWLSEEQLKKHRLDRIEDVIIANKD